MTADKYGSGQDPYCYENSTVLRNLLNLQVDADLEDAERRLSSARADAIEFQLPPYDFNYLKSLHRSLFRDIYSWAGETRTVDISKDSTRFCTFSRIAPESRKFFSSLAERNCLEGLSRENLIHELAQANIKAVFCDYTALIQTFEKAVGHSIS
ncbi:MAG: Fic family protein [Gammaproteobacteria bacterium]|nr:Fic family protein [Gammaproteobacteria bacterium]